MAALGTRSLLRLRGVHPEIAGVLLAAIEHFDFTVLEGGRTLESQKEKVASGASQTLNSKHLMQKSGFYEAVDIAPYPIDWEDHQRFAYMAGLIMGIAESKGVKLTWGHDWDNDGDFKEHTLKDGPHFQLR